LKKKHFSLVDRESDTNNKMGQEKKVYAKKRDFLSSFFRDFLYLWEKNFFYFT